MSSISENREFNTIDQTLDALLKLQEITIISHIRPDGDTLGSAFALMHALKKFGKSRVEVVCESEISPRYRFLTGGKSRIDGPCRGGIVCVDVASPSMAGERYRLAAENADVVIDHHLSNSGYGKYNLIDSDAAACGEIVLRLVERLNGVDSTVADCLYTAVSTDTGCFVYSNTTSETHEAAAKLIRAGADAGRLNKLLFRTKSHAAFEIERRAFDSLEYFYDNTVTCMKIALEWIEELSANEDDMEGISSIPARIEGVKASATFRQVGKDTYKLSVRTNGEVDASTVCKMFGGGGHKMAAGCTMTGDYNSLKKIMADSLYKGINK